MRSLCARKPWPGSSAEEAESARELQRIFERRLSKALAEAQEQTEELAETEAQEQTEERLLEASENGKQVIECFEELEQDGCEILRHRKVHGDWDSVLYELRLMSRAISATPRFCEMYYIWGSQDSGKDTKVKMLHAFLGQGQLRGAASGKLCGAQTGPAPYHARTLALSLEGVSQMVYIL